MIYKAYLKQDGDGCDYSIGCAQTVISIDAHDVDEAMQKLYDIIEEQYTGNRALELCELYEINRVIVCDLTDRTRCISEVNCEKQKHYDEELERKEYFRLKTKYENTKA